MYKALIEIGGYKPGEIVPDEIARVWEGMYKESPVQKIEEEKVEEVKEELKKEEVKESEEENAEVMIDDYLDRNKNVVISNIKEDKLSKNQLVKMADYERNSKNRKQVLSAIDNRLDKISSADGNVVAA